MILKFYSTAKCLRGLPGAGAARPEGPGLAGVDLDWEKEPRWEEGGAPHSPPPQACVALRGREQEMECVGGAGLREGPRYSGAPNTGRLDGSARPPLLDALGVGVT